MEITFEECPIAESEPGYRRAQNRQLFAILRILRPDSGQTSGDEEPDRGIIEGSRATIGMEERRRSE